MTRDELVEKMLGAYWQDCRPCETCEPGQSTGMSAALSVAIEELLKDPSEGEMISIARAGVNWAFGKGLDYDRVRDIIANRRAKLERVKTPEEVTKDTSSHLVRGRETLCGLSEWHSGNVDLPFGVKSGTANCIACLRIFASELLAQRQKLKEQL